MEEYRILSRMAAGSFGVVFKVERLSDEHPFVMKRIPLLELSPSERRDAEREFVVMSEVCHPFTVKQHDAFLFNDNDLCLIIDYYDGGDMDRSIRRQREEDAYFPFQRVMEWFTEMLLAVHYLHSKGIIHHDLKAHNIFFNGSHERIAVGDFGVSEKVEPNALHHWILNLEKSYDTLLLPDELTRALRSPRASPLPPAVPTSPRGDSGSSGGGGAAAVTASSSPSVTPALTEVPPSTNAGEADGENAEDDDPSSPMQQENISPLMKGTPLYMAPEVLLGATSSIKAREHKKGQPPPTLQQQEDLSGQKGDMWSLGCILYELLCLRHPFYSRDMGVLVMRVTRGDRAPLPPHYPPEVCDVVNRLLALNPSDRPSCKELLRLPLISSYAACLLAANGLIDVAPGNKESSDGNAADASGEHREGEQPQAEEVEESRAALQRQLNRLKLSLDPSLAEETTSRVSKAIATAPPPSVEHAEASSYCERLLVEQRTALMGSERDASPSYRMGRGDGEEDEGDDLNGGGSADDGEETEEGDIGVGSGSGRARTSSSRSREPSARGMSRDCGPFIEEDDDAISERGGTAATARSTGTAGSSTGRRRATGGKPPAPPSRGSSGSPVPYPELWGQGGYPANVMDVIDAPVAELQAEVDAMRRLLLSIYQQRSIRTEALRQLQEPQGHTLPTGMGKGGVGGPVMYTPANASMRQEQEAVDVMDSASKSLGMLLEEWAPLAELPMNCHHAPPVDTELLPSLLPYTERRDALHRSLFPFSEEEEDATAAAGCLTRKEFADVYAYYASHDLVSRVPADVRVLVPRRATWRHLPVVEEILRIDCWLRRQLPSKG